MVTKATGNMDEALARALLDGAFLTRNQLDSLMRARIAGKSLRGTILERGILSSEIVASVLAFVLDLPVVDVRQCVVQPAALDLLPEELCRNLGVIPISVEGGVLRLVTEEPLDESGVAVVESLTHLRVKPILALNGGVQEAIDQHCRPEQGQPSRLVEAWEASARSQSLEATLLSESSPSVPLAPGGLCPVEASGQAGGSPRWCRLEGLHTNPFSYVTNAVRRRRNGRGGVDRGAGAPPAPANGRGTGRVSQDLQFLFWLGAIMFFGFGDTLTSLMVFSNSGREANVLLAGLLRTIGPTVMGFVVVKMAATLAVVLASRLWPRVELFASLSMLTAGMFLVAQNSTILLLSRV
ncbi:MAG: hypothetical protein HYY01_00935 [Chloroflexi bacterium]|nr:hypothetical protein [Chloroflexota bacterium]